MVSRVIATLVALLFSVIVTTGYWNITLVLCLSVLFYLFLIEPIVMKITKSDKYYETLSKRDSKRNDD